MDQEKGYGDYKQRLEALTADEYFLSQDQKKKGLLIAGLRDEYLASMPDVDEQTAKTISDLSKIKSDYVKGDRYRVEADDFIKAGLEYPAIADQSKEKALENIDSFRKQIDERSVDFDPVFRDDYVYDLKRLADEEERAVRGEGVGRTQDLHNRYVKGWTGSLLRGVGMTEAADKLDLEFFPVNPEYDADFISKLSTGGGDMVATMGIVFGATAVAGPWAGGAAGLATNATRKYQDAYKQEFDASGNAELAHQAGLASTPGAALETAGEMLVAGRFSKLLPKGFRQEFLKAPNAAARSEVVRKALAETSTRAKLGAIAFNSMQEGTSEVTGDFVSGLGSAAVTGRESFVPTGAEAAETFAISALLGGVMGGVEAGLRRPDAALRGQQETIKGMLDKGDYEGVSGLARQRIIDTAKPDKDTPTVPEKPQAKPSMSKAEQAVENGEVSNSITNDRGERIKVDERTAKIHDSLIDSLTRRGYVDELNALEPGKKKGQRSNIKTNNDRAIELDAIKAQEEQLNIELPERARLFSEIDKVGEEVINMDPDKASMVKRLMDAAALTTIQYGMDPNTVYQGMSYRVDQTTEQAKAVARRGKARSIQETFNRESEQLGLPTEVQTELDELTGSVDTGMLEQARKQDVREHFAPEAFKQFERSNLGWKEVLVDMPIDEYLSLAAPIKPTDNKMSEVQDGGPAMRTSEDNATALRELIEQGSAIPELPQLYLDDYKQEVSVTGHEGRHRAMALKAMGYDTIPVVLNSRKIRWSEQTGTGRDPGYYMIPDDQWPTKLISEKGDVTIDFPIDRQGRHRNSISSQDELFQYAGRRANLTPQQQLNRDIAFNMKKAGRPDEEIRMATGWFYGKYDGKPRWEISDDIDSGVNVKPMFDDILKKGQNKDTGYAYLEMVLDHPELYEAYPDIKKVMVYSYEMDGNTNGAYYESNNQIVIDAFNENPFETLMHEIQHWIQAKEGFARGGNSSMIDTFVSDENIDPVKKEAESFKENELKRLGNIVDFYKDYESRVIPTIDESEFLRLTDEVNDVKDKIVASGANPINDLASDLSIKNQSLSKILGLDDWSGALVNEDILRTAIDSNSIEDFKSRLGKRHWYKQAILKNRIETTYTDLSNPDQLKEFIKEFKLGYNMYRLLAGEIEARDTAERIDLDARQRKRTEPYSSQDIPADQAIVRFRPINDTNSISSQDQLKLTNAEQEFLSDFDDIDFEEMTDVVGIGRIFSIEGGSLVIEDQYKPALISYLERISREPKQDRGKLPPGLHNESLIKKIQNSINADQLNNELQQTPVNGQPYYGRFFHGGSFSGGQIKASKDGSLGAGYYFTTQDRAAGYAKTSGSTQQEIQGGSVRAFDVLFDKPLVINMDGQPNFVEGLIFEALGMPREKAFEKAEKIIEEKGFISKHFQTLGKKLGYDGIIQIRDGQVSEMVAWDADSLTDLGNADQLNNELFQKTVQDLWRNLTPAKNAPRTLQVGNSIQSAKQVVEQFLAKNPTVTSKNGRTVQLHHAKQGSIDILVQHLSTREDGSFDARRAMHTSRIPHTLQNAEIVATDEKTKNVLYFARYRDKTTGRPGQKSREFDNVHVVLVKPDGTLANHGEITEDIWTQFVRDFADGPAKTQGAMPAELLQSMGLVDGSLETSNRSGGDMSVQSLNPTTPTDATSANVGGITTVDGITEQPSTANAASPAPSTLAGATKLADAFSVEVDNNSKLSQSQGENFVKVLFGGQPSKPKGRIQFQNEDGSIAPLNVPIDQLDNKLRSIITISRTSGDVSTFMHETMHYLHRSGILAKLLSAQELEAFERAAGLGADRIWRVENYEAVARGFEGWLRNPLLPFESKIRVPAILERVFRKMSSAMTNIYKSLRDSGLPFEDRKGRAVPNIHPDFRVAFERLFSFDPSLRLGQPDIKSPPTDQANNTAQNASQLPSVNRQLTGGGKAGSSQRAAKNATDAQLSAKDSEPDKDERTSEDRLNIKLIRNMTAKHRLDNAVLAAFNSVVELSAGLHLDKELSGLFYNILDNFVTSRRLNKSAKREQQLREPFAPKIDEGKYSIDFFKPIKDPGDPAYSRQVISRLNQIRDEAFKLWFEQYKARNPKTMGETTVDDIDPNTGEKKFTSKLDVIKFNAENKEKEASEEEETSARRQSINDNVATGQLALRERDPATLPGANLPDRFEPLKAVINRYYEFLKAVDVNTEEMNDRDAFKIQLHLDALLNDDTLLGLADFAKHEMQAKLGEATGLEKYRAAYARFGLVGILARFGRDISETVTGLRLTSINIEAIARTDSAKRFLNNVLIDDYYDAVTKAQVLKHEYKAFLKATREKYFGKYGTDPIQMHTAGIISKIMQAPIDLDADQLVKAIQNNIAQLRQGFTNEAERGGINGKHAGQLKIKLLDNILAGLPAEFDQEQFIDHVQEKFPNETGYVMDNVQWIADNLTAGSQMVVEGLWATQFNPQGYYLPTRQVSLDPQKGDEIELDGSFFENQYGGDKFSAKNPVTVKRSGSLQARTGFLADKERSTYNTNLEYVLEEAVNGIISDIYTGFERKKLGYLLNTSKQTPDSLRAQFEEMLSTDGNDGADAVKHLRKTIHDMVSTDLGQHRYINQLEALASAIRKNIAPAMLSSLHQPITQTISAFVSHVTRRRHLIQYYASALKLAMDHTLGNAPASFNTMFERHLSDRAPAHDYLLAKGQSIPRTTPLDKLGDYIIGQANIDKKSFVEFRNKAKLIDGKIKDSLLAGLRFGDMFSAKVIFAAELLHAAKQEQGRTDAAKVEYDRIKPATMTEIMNVMDEAINASRNSRRGTILAHPGAVLSMLTIFAGHRISVASATGLRIRNAIELGMDKNFSDGMFGDSAKYAIATAFQSITFSALKWGVMGMLVKGLYQAMTPEEDDERHWLYGDMEREEVEQIRELTDERYESSFGPNTLGTAILRDMFGNVFLTWAFGGVDNFMFTGMDVPFKENFKQGKEEALDQIRKQLQQRASLLSEAEIADLNRQYDAIEKMKYVPMGFKSFGSDDFSGSLGAALQPAMDFATALNESTFTSKRMSVEDFALAMRFFGYGQPELTRALKILAKKKDMDAERTAEDELNEYDF